MIVGGVPSTAKMGRYCLCSRIDFFLANSLLASLFFFMYLQTCSVLKHIHTRPKCPAWSPNFLLTGYCPASCAPKQELLLT